MSTPPTYYDPAAFDAENAQPEDYTTRKVESLIDVDALIDELPPNDYARSEIIKVLAVMIDRRIPPTPATVEHALEAEDIKHRLRELGIVIYDDGRNGQISPTKNHKGLASLTFKQMRALLTMAEDAEDVR